ncbi:16S rRNA (guanine(527)-N(7))-methyltransferase RsmG [Gracilinema caldarium]|uniref:Ribosomal RNA small subunit methyltransferase G n=1 Tax=Gracilinema caldarium (strain ATCC 51460 / DSM 7334 / H1) TaxID=744872 RepID=F8F469_GRAC1|nr:16S rRNA (guanine(527)-N(7))-methyltransferase RsmG [Gracilinema caldarium]AEJ20516.1 Ribosomal RNA small subunit methyltransferase G [Gracilinema caldarium DSM 7334]
MDELLDRGLTALLEQNQKLNTILTGDQRIRFQEKLESYVRELELFNPAYGLVGAESHEELIIKHILDSLAPLGHILRALSPQPAQQHQLLQSQPAQQHQLLQPQPALDLAANLQPSPSIADAGTGAGLPGLPLAMALPDCRFTLIERMGRRIGFLQNTLAVLGLENVRLEQADIEKTRSGPFDLITFRAFRPLEPPILRALVRLLTPGGKLAAYKGRLDKIREEMAPIESLVTTWEAMPVQVPFLNEERHIVMIQP